MNIRVQFTDFPSVLYVDVYMNVHETGALILTSANTGNTVAAFPQGFWTMAEEEVARA